MKYVLNTDRCCLVWHGHHEAQSPIEILPESFDSRMKTIETMKAKEETPEQITRRKQLFRLVIGPLPPAMRKAYAEWRKAYAVFISSHCAETMALHAKQCGCGWTPTTRNIFKYKDEAQP